MKRFRRGKPFQETQTQAVEVPRIPNDVTNTGTPNLPCMSFTLPCGRRNTVHHACHVSLERLPRARHLVGRSPSRDSLLVDVRVCHVAGES